MGRHETAAVEDADHVGQLMHLDDAPGPIGNAVVVAADRDEPVMADAPFELEERVEGCCRQRLQVGLLGREGLRRRSAASCRAAGRWRPCRASRASWALRSSRLRNERAEEEVLADVAERPLDLALRFGPVRAAGSGQEADSAWPSAMSERL